MNINNIFVFGEKVKINIINIHHRCAIGYNVISFIAMIMLKEYARCLFKMKILIADRRSQNACLAYSENS